MAKALEAPDLIDPFHRQLYGVLTEEISRRMTQLALGSAARTGSASVEENYAAQTTYIKALNNILDKCQEIETERYGGRKSADAA
jgi:hypothetical protein